MIQLKQIEKIYQKAKPNEVTALKGVSLTIHDGDLIAVTGPSGSGKTTLLHILACLEKPDAGEYILNGQNVAELSERKKADLRNSYFGILSGAAADWKNAAERSEKSGRKRTGTHGHSVPGDQKGQSAQRRTKTAGRHCPGACSQTANHSGGRTHRGVGFGAHGRVITADSEMQRRGHHFFDCYP